MSSTESMRPNKSYVSTSLMDYCVEKTSIGIVGSAVKKSVWYCQHCNVIAMSNASLCILSSAS